MPGSTPPTSQLDWLGSTTAMIVLSWSRPTRDLLKSFGWGIAALHRLDAATKLPPPRCPPHRIFSKCHTSTSSSPCRNRSPPSLITTRDPSTISSIGRFAVEYQTLFGETPSATPHRQPECLGIYFAEIAQPKRSASVAAPRWFCSLRELRAI